MRFFFWYALRWLQSAWEPYREPLLYRAWWVPNAFTLVRGFIVAPILATIFALQLFATPADSAETIDLMTFRTWALVLTIAGLATDGIDGFLAKRYAAYGWQTDFGKKVDPLMDKWFTYVGFGVVPLYYGLGIYLVWFLPFAYAIDKYSRETTGMRRRGEILEANEHARKKTGFLFIAQVAFMLAVAGEDYVREEKLEVFATLMFFVAFGAMLWACILCRYAMADYRRIAAKQQIDQGRGFATALTRAEAAE